MKIFLAHKTRDKPTVNDFRKELPEFLEAWLDDKSLTWGDELEVSIENAITNDVAFVILFLSDDTLAAPWVQRECTLALKREKELGRIFLLPIILGSVSSETLPKHISSRLYLTCDCSARSLRDVGHQAAEHLFGIVVREYESMSKDTLREVIRQARRGVYAGDSMWTRPMLRGSSWKLSVVEDTMTVLRAAVDTAHKALSEFVPGAKKSNVRSNIFLPTTEGIPNGDVCTLRIPEVDKHTARLLQYNMESPEEMQLAFRPNEGVTGKVFAEEEAKGVIVKPTWLDADDEARKCMKDQKWSPVDLNPSHNLSEPEVPE